MIALIEYLNLPAKIALVLIFVFLVMNGIGEILEVKGKIVPEWMKVRKWFARRKEEKKTLAEIPITLAEVKQLLSDVNGHYSADNIAKRDGWIKTVNEKLDRHDAWVREFTEKLDKNNEDTTSLLVESKRSTIISFASFVADENNRVTREQFNRIFRLHTEYEKIIKESGQHNGEVDVAIRIIRESYEQHMREQTFLEDVRWK